VDSEAELVNRLRRGDEAAFALLVDRYQSSMLRLARALLPGEEPAKEAVQDTWLAVVRGIDNFEGRSSLKTWLFRILVNRAKSNGAREWRDRPLAAPSVDPSCFDRVGAWRQPVAEWEEQVAERVDARRWALHVRSALDGLPSRQRAVVILRDIEGMSSDEVCSLVGVTPGNQRLLLHRGRAALRDALRPAMEA
jgi:RNA polymerase sigma-70 factor, ECF subfamily